MGLPVLLSKPVMSVEKLKPSQPFAAKKDLLFTLPASHDQFVQVGLTPLDPGLFTHIFHDPVSRADHIASILPNGQLLKPAIFDVLKAEHDAELAIDTTGRQLASRLKGQYGTSFEKLMENQMERSRKVFSYLLSEGRQGKYDDSMLDKLTKIPNSEEKAHAELVKANREIEELAALPLKKRADFEKTLDQPTLNLWLRAFHSSSPNAPPSIREQAGYLLNLIQDEMEFSKKQAKKKSQMLHNAEQFLTLREDLLQQYLASLDDKGRENLMHFFIGHQLTPKRQAEQIEFMERRMPKQATPEKQKALDENIYESVRDLRKLPGKLAFSFAKPFLELLADENSSKNKDLLSAFGLSVENAFKSFKQELDKTDEKNSARKKYFENLDPATRIAHRQASLSLLQNTLVLKPLSLAKQLFSAI